VGVRKTAQLARQRHRDREANHSIRILADQAFSRTAGAPLIPGNSVRILKDATENYPAWLAAIESAERTIHFESYIIHEDDLGQQFAEALMAKARAGVRVRLIYDWLGAISATSRRFWRNLRQAGVEVRCFNPPHIDSPFGWLSRDHRKMISVDGKVGFVTGLCVGRLWVGYPEQKIDPWRDTGVEVRGPAVADIERAFAQIWSEMGPPIPEEELARDIPPAGNVTLRVIASMPNTAGLYRLDQLIAAGARKSLWLTDAYFVGTTPYVQALCAAAKDGVDVRLLVPQATDIMLIRSLSRAGYRPLLEAGVRVFEWNGPMLHAKTAVADGRWARVGSSNLNLASWIGNYELDVSVEDEGFAKEMMEMYEDDLENSTEIVLNDRNRVRSTRRRPSHRRSRRKIGHGSTTRAAAGAIRLGNTVGAAITNHRVLGPAEAQIMIMGGLLLLVLSVVSVIWPLLLTIPFAAVGIWFAITLLFRAYALHASGRKELREVDAKTVTNPEAISGVVDEGSKRP
jgi:cardiolipin synthase